MRPGLDLLDVGCGPGTITRDLARLVAPGRVVAVDAAAGVLDEARRTCEEAGIGNVEFHQAAAESLPFADASFDVVHAHQVLQHVRAPVQVLREMRRVCRSDGTVAARDGDYHGQAWWPLEPVMDRWLSLYSDVARCNGGEPDAGRRLSSSAMEAGFSAVRCSASTFCVATSEQCQWWGELWAERTTSSALGERLVELGMADADELSLIADGWRRWATVPGAWLAIVHGEVLCDP